MIIPNPENILLFLTAAIILVTVPGPAVFYILAKSIEQGQKAGLISVLGIALGGLVHVVAAAIGISAILVASATAFGVIKYLGALYLIYLGVKKIIGTQSANSTSIVSKNESLKKVFYEGIVVNILNPKTAIFFFAFLPQFINVALGAVTSQIIFLGILFIAVAIFSDCLYVFAATKISKWLNKSPHYLDVQKYVTGAIYILLGLVSFGVSQPIQASSK